MNSDVLTNDTSGARFTPAECPGCGGELRLPTGQSTVKCMYCGIDIVVSNVLGAANEANVANWSSLARAAEEAGNSEEAFRYHTKILEVDPSNAEAWFGKGIAAGWQTTLANIRLNEMLTGVNKAIELTEEGQRPELLDRAANHIGAVAMATCQISRQHAEAFASADNVWSQHIHISDQVLAVLRIAREWAPRDATILEGIITVCDGLLRGVSYETVEATFGLPVTATSGLSSEYKAEIQSVLQTHVEALKEIQPNYRPPKTALKSDCFVATAALGSRNHDAVVQLRAFRDQWLSRRCAGRIFIAGYGVCGPVLARIIKKSRVLRALSRWLIVYPSARLARILLR